MTSEKRTKILKFILYEVVLLLLSILVDKVIEDQNYKYFIWTLLALGGAFIIVGFTTELKRYEKNAIADKEFEDSMIKDGNKVVHLTPEQVAALKKDGAIILDDGMQLILGDIKEWQKK